MRLSLLPLAPLALAALTTLAAAGAPGPPPKLAAGVAREFHGYRRMTKKPVPVNPDLALLCRGAWREDITRLRPQFGPHTHTEATIYMNPAAARAFPAGEYPVGAVIVKDKRPLSFLDDSTEPDGLRRSVQPPPGVAGMIKRPEGYNRDHGDWEYFYVEAGSSLESGRLASCVNCHDRAKKTGYVFGDWSKPNSLARLLMEFGS